MAQYYCSCSSLPSSKISSSDSEQGMRRRIRKGHRGRGCYPLHQVSDLCDNLSEGNQTMMENERLMSDFRDNSMRQRDEIYQLKKDLDRSRELLHQSSSADKASYSHTDMCNAAPKCTHMHTMTSNPGNCDCYHQQTIINLEREKLARERSDAEKAVMIDLLNTSLTQPTNFDSQLQNLSSDVKALKSELLEAQLGVNKTEATTANMESRVRRIENEVKEGSSCHIGERELHELSEEIKSIKEDLLVREATLTQQRMLDELKDLERQLKAEHEAHGCCQMEVGRLSEQVSRLRLKLQHAQEENKRVSCRCDELEHELAQCRTNIESDHNELLLLRNKNADLQSELQIKSCTSGKKLHRLSDRCQQLESQKAELQANSEAHKQLITKYEEDLFKLQSDKDSLMRKNSSLHQNLSQMTDQTNHLTEHTDAVKAQHKEQTEALISHQSSLAKKFKQLTVLCRSLKTELSTTQSELTQLRNKKSKLEGDLRVVQQSCVHTKQELHQQIETVKQAHKRELDSLVQEHNRVLTLLKQENAQLQIQLSNEQSTVRAVRHQQRKVLEDQHKMAEQDLSRFLKDSERVKHKYIRTKKYFKEKMFQLQNKLDASKCEGCNGITHSPSMSQEAVTQLTDEQNTMLKALAFEVNILVEKLRNRVDMPESLTMPPSIGSGTKTLFADLLTNTQWLKGEVEKLVAQDDALRALHLSQVAPSLNNGHTSKLGSHVQLDHL